MELFNNMLLGMPGRSYREQLPPLTSYEQELVLALQQDLQQFVGDIGEHNYLCYDNLKIAENFLVSSLESSGYTVKLQGYEIDDRCFNNIEVEIPGTEKADEILVIGAHYDSIVGSPGANDNGSGVVALLALARAFQGRSFPRTLRFVAFVNEEPPFFCTEKMGSLVYARRCHDLKEKIVGMMSLETMGYYDAKPGSQQYPIGLLNNIYPVTGDFIAFVSSFTSQSFIKQVVKSFRSHTQFPSEGTALPDNIPGIGWSDHWSFWQVGYPALMITDTAPFRYPHYHTSEDTPDKVNYDGLARVVAGIERVILELLS